MWQKLKPQWAALALILMLFVSLMIRYPLHFWWVHWAPLPGDFGVYFKAWQRVVAEVMPYQPDDASPYKYSPGVLALVGLLPNSPNTAWIVFSSISIGGFCGALWIGTRFTSWKSFGLLVLGLAMCWKGVIETMDYGQLELIIMAISIFSGALIWRFPFISGLVLGVLPWIKLPWALLLIPFSMFAWFAKHVEVPKAGVPKPVAKSSRRFRLFVSGYFMALFFWGAAVPSMVFGPEKAKLLSQAWVHLLRTQPSNLYFSDINQSVWVSSYRWVGGSHGLAISLAAFVVLGILFFAMRRLVKTIKNKDHPEREVFGWLGAWLVLTQLMNPLSWRWGSALLPAAPFSANFGGLQIRRVRPLLWTSVAMLWLAQLNPVARFLGYSSWNEFHGAGLVTAYWLTLLLLCL
jgi:hypothetical protein